MPFRNILQLVCNIRTELYVVYFGERSGLASTHFPVVAGDPTYLMCVKTNI